VKSWVFLSVQTGTNHLKCPQDSLPIQELILLRIDQETLKEQITLQIAPPQYLEEIQQARAGLQISNIFVTFL
jgi:hypothetical protein